MEERKYNDEELKARIYAFYSEYYDPSSDRSKALGQLWFHVCKWCRHYLYKKEEKFLYEKGDDVEVEIYKTVKRCAEKDKMPEKDFFPYLYVSLVNAKNQYYRDHLQEGSLKETRTLRKIKGCIEALEKSMGRETTQDERFYYISEEMPEIKKETTIRDYLQCLASSGAKYKFNTKIDKSGKEVSIFDIIEGNFSTYEKEITDDNIAEIIKEEFEKYINGKQERTIPFLRAIYTLDCVENNKDYNKLRPILDRDILEICEKRGKDGEKLPAKYEIYMKYHSDSDKKTAVSNASSMLKDFVNGFEAILRKAIKEEYPNIRF